MRILDKHFDLRIFKSILKYFSGLKYISEQLNLLSPIIRFLIKKMVPNVQVFFRIMYFKNKSLISFFFIFYIFTKCYYSYFNNF